MKLAGKFRLVDLKEREEKEEGGGGERERTKLWLE
jgi:hypothetical protein